MKTLYSETKQLPALDKIIYIMTTGWVSYEIIMWSAHYIQLWFGPSSIVLTTRAILLAGFSALMALIVTLAFYIKDYYES
jgi:hypothetical protein